MEGWGVRRMSAGGDRAPPGVDAVLLRRRAQVSICCGSVSQWPWGDDAEVSRVTLVTPPGDRRLYFGVTALVGLILLLIGLGTWVWLVLIGGVGWLVGVVGFVSVQVESWVSVRKGADGALSLWSAVLTPRSDPNAVGRRRDATQVNIMVLTGCRAEHIQRIAFLGGDSTSGGGCCFPLKRGRLVGEVDGFPGWHVIGEILVQPSQETELLNAIASALSSALGHPVVVSPPPTSLHPSSAPSPSPSTSTPAPAASAPKDVEMGHTDTAAVTAAL
jgi:hypothetical protein